MKLGGDRRKITILTSDLRGFTSLSERLPPEEVINILNLYLPKEEEVFFPVGEEILIQYALLDGKNISDTLLRGSLIELSDKGAKVRSKNVGEDNLPSALANLKLNLLTPDTPAEVSEDIYAKVLEKPAQKGSFYIRFTATPPTVQAKLDAFYKSISVRGSH